MQPAVREFGEQPYTGTAELLGQFFLGISGQIVSSIIANICASFVRLPLRMLAFYARPNIGDRAANPSFGETSKGDPSQGEPTMEEIEELVELPGCFSGNSGGGGKVATPEARKAARRGAVMVDAIYYSLSLLIGAGCILYLILISSYFANQEDILQVQGLSVRLEMPFFQVLFVPAIFGHVSLSFADAFDFFFVFYGKSMLFCSWRAGSGR
jgi:hypothetical protein